MMMKGKTLPNIVFALLATVIITYFYPHPEANQYKFEEGRAWNYSQLIAPFDIPIKPDSATVQYVRDSLTRTFVPVFERNNDAANTTITNIMARWTQADSENGQDTPDPVRRKAIASLRAAYAHDVIDEEYGQLIEEGALPTIRIILANTVRSATTNGISSPKQVIDYMRANLGLDSVSARKWIEDNDIESMLVPNLVYNKATSDRLYNNDLDRLTAIKGVIQQGQTIIDKGAIITPQDYTNLCTYESMVNEQLSSATRYKWLMWAGQGLYVVLMLTVLMTYLFFSNKDVWANRRAVMFILLIITLFFLISVALDSSIPNGAYITPFAIVPVLMIVFFDAPTAVISSLVLSMLCAGTVTFPFEFIVLQMLASIAAVYSLKELSQRSQLLRTSLFVMCAYLIGYLAIELMMNGNFEGLQWRMAIFLAVSSGLSSIAYILMVVIERLFGFVSVVTLIELADTNNPVLRELSQECPGTFQHSMAVANLASDAAIKIKANEQLVRAGALYHDIGKIANPNFYTENQRGINPHDTLPTEQSARIIIGHVADGLNKADKIGLPAVIKDFISQHHGRGKAKYFYYTYCNQHPGEEVDPAPFTYPGPNPQTREASLLMMADSVEAASRSLKEHTPEAIRELVNRIIDGQIADGLHNESPLHFRDVSIIKDAFVRRLMTMYHSRIVYPEKKE